VFAPQRRALLGLAQLNIFIMIMSLEDSQKEPSALQDYEKRLAAVYGLGTVELGKNGGEVTFYPREHLAQVLEEVIQYEGQGRDLVLYPLPLLAKIT